MSIRTLKPLLGCIAILAILQGCGAGTDGGTDASNNGSSSSPSSTSPESTPSAPAAPTAALTIGLKKLQFSWPAVAGATSYKVLENTDGSADFQQIGGDLSADQTTYTKAIAVHTQQWATASYQIQACNTVGCSTSNTLSATNGVLQAIGYFKASNTNAGDTYGWTLALSGDGNTLAVGAPGEDSAASGSDGNQADNSAIDSGAVYVYGRDNAGNWRQLAYLKASNSTAGANFGEALALSDDGQTLVVGAPLEDSAATIINGNQTNHGAAGAGAVYVFSRSADSWTQQAYVKAANAYANAYFGWSVALSADGATIAVGATGDSSNAKGINGNGANHSTANAGAAYIFSRNGSSWAQQAYIKASNTAAEDNFGVAVQLNANGNILAVGAPYEASAATGVNGSQSSNSAPNAGAVYVFSRNAAAWSQQAYLKASNSGAQDNFGSALALNAAGTTLAVGAPYESSVPGNPASNTAIDAGAVYVFAFNNGWSQQALVKASNADANDDFGSAVALSSDGNTLLVGAIGESSNATGINGLQTDNTKEGVGAAYLFQRANNTWSQRTYLKPSSAAIGNEFGSSVALSDDTATLAISGSYERSGASGIGGNQADTSSADAGALWLF